MSQSRFSGLSKGVGFDPFQNSASEIAIIRIVALWQRTKECKFLASENIANVDIFESIFGSGLVRTPSGDSAHIKAFE
jgi:hypothetical protein